MIRLSCYLSVLVLLSTTVHAKPLIWGSQVAGDIASCDGQEMLCYAPGIIRPDQGTVQITVKMDKPSTEFGNDWDSLFRMKPARDIGGNSLLTLTFPRVSLKDKGLWLVARSNDNGKVGYGNVSVPDITFAAGQTVKLAFSWGHGQLRIYCDGKRMGSAPFNHPLMPMPAVFSVARLSPMQTTSVKISSIQLDDQMIAADAQRSLSADANTTFLAVDQLKTAQTFITPWHQASGYTSVTPYWSPASQCFVQGDAVTFPVLAVNQSNTDQNARVTLSVLDSKGQTVAHEQHDLSLKALEGYRQIMLPVTKLPAFPGHYDVHTTISTGQSQETYDSSIVVIPAMQQGISEGKMAQYLGYHYELAFDARPLEQMGVHWLRMWGVEPLLWFNVEPVKGQYCWDKADLVMRQARSHGLQLLGLLGNMPRWAAVEPDEKHKAMHRLANVPGRWKPRDMDEWENYASKVMDHCKDTIKYWEVCNEVDFHPPGKPGSFSGSTDEYLEMLKRVHRQSRIVGSDVKVLLSGLSMVSACDQNMPTDLINKGACDYIDAFNLHAYQVLHRVDELKKAVHAVKPGLPFWQTEQMWMHITQQDKRLWLTPAIYLWFMEEGFEKFFTFGFYDMYFNKATLSPTQDHYVNAVFQNQIRVCDRYAGLLTFAGDTSFAVRHQLQRTDGSMLTVIGSAQGSSELVIKAQPGLRAVDLMGHPIAIEQTNSQMKLVVKDMAYLISPKPLTIMQTIQRNVAELMANGSFEDVTGDIDMAGLEAGTPTHWKQRTTQYDPQGTITLNREARTGEFAMQIQSSGAGRVYLYEDIRIPAAGDYLLTAWLRKPDPTSSALAYMSYFDREKSIFKAQKLAGVTSDYQRFQMLIHFDGASTLPVAMNVGIYTGSGILLVDDVNVQAIEPLRIPLQSSSMIPLKPYGNWPLSENLVDADRRVDLPVLAKISGKTALGGVCFDLPGGKDRCVLVADSQWPGTTTQVTGIPVNQKLTRLAFAHTAMYLAAKPGQSLGQYILHYADGTQANLPIRLDRELRDWFVPAQKPDDQAPKPACLFNTASGSELSVFCTLVDNPEPEKQIVTIDLVSQSPGVLCLLGLTGQMP